MCYGCVFGNLLTLWVSMTAVRNYFVIKRVFLWKYLQFERRLSLISLNRLYLINMFCRGTRWLALFSHSRWNSLTVLQNIAINEHNNKAVAITPETRSRQLSTIKCPSVAGCPRHEVKVAATKDSRSCQYTWNIFLVRPHNNIYLSFDLTATFVFVPKSNKVESICIRSVWYTVVCVSRVWKVFQYLFLTKY